MKDPRRPELVDRELDARLRRDLPAVRRLPSEELVAGTLAALEGRSPSRAPRHEARWRRRPPAWSLAAALPLLFTGALWAWFGTSEAPEVPAQESVVAVDAELPSWLAPEELLASLERGAQAEGQRLVRDLDRVREAVWGDLPWAGPFERALEARAGQPSPR